MPGLLEGVRIVLVEPQHPGNVGAAARAMKSTGLKHLVVVDPPAFDMERARWMAPGCEDLFDTTRFVGTLDEALQGVHLAVATTARHRRHRQPVLEPADFAPQVLDAPPGQSTAVLFGREDFGLSREATARCHSLLRIPTLEHASLNLAQAVLIIAWSLFEEARRRGLDAQGRLVGGHTHKPTAVYERRDGRDARADLPTLEPAVFELVALLDRVGYTRAAGPEKVGVTARSALQRAGLSRREVEAIRGMVSRIEWALDHPDVDWTKTRKG
ncbi:MAG: RNA methyltransferase [Deltaproteobacteria bacterium]|nr:RNA methyltransferase [Deltaproteobacteria bacterium]MBW2253079.1 RNA methyltransferase [Deltaproteobacteria bacterium]